MSGYEELSPDQLITIAYLAFGAVTIFAVSMLLRSIFNYLAAKTIMFRMEQEVARNIAMDLNQQTWVEKIKSWWAARKERKAEPDPFAKYMDMGKLE